MPRLVFQDFSGGLWLPAESDTTPATRQPGFAIPQNGLLLAQDIEYLPSGGVRGRRGRTLYGVIGGDVVGLFRHYPRSETTSEGPHLATTATNDTTSAGRDGVAIGGSTWFNPNNALLEDGLTANNATLPSCYLSVTFGGFAIPGGAEVTGIQVDVKRRAQLGVAAASAHDLSVLIVAASGISLDKAYTFINWPSYLVNATSPQPPVWISYGGPGDLWGLDTVTVAEVNGATLTFLFAADSDTGNAGAQVDAIRMTVFYTFNIVPTFLLANTTSTAMQYRVDNGSGSFSLVTGGVVDLPMARPRFVNWPEKNKTFLFDGVNPVKSWNGVLIEDVPAGQVNQILPHRGPYATLHQNRLYATDPAELNFSVYASEILDETEWPPFLQLSINDAVGGSLVGLESFQGRLLIFKTSGVWVFIGDPDPVSGGAILQKISETGCVAADSIQRTPYGVIYLGREGVYVTDGESVVELSRPIRPLFAERATQHVYPTALAVYYPRKDHYIINLKPELTAELGGEAASYVVSRLPAEDETRTAWATHARLRPNCWSVWNSDEDNGDIFYGDDSGRVFRFDTGTTDAGDDIRMNIETAARLLDPENRQMARVYQCEPLVRLPASSTTLILTLQYNNKALSDLVTDLETVPLTITFSSAPPAVNFREPRRYITDRSILGRFLSVQLVFTTSNAPDVELHRVDCELMFRGRRVWRPA